MWKLKASIPQIVELLKSSWARNAVKIFLKYTVNSWIDTLLRTGDLEHLSYLSDSCLLVERQNSIV
jgi:hypothetical protein